MNTLEKNEKNLPKEVYEAIATLMRFLEDAETKYKVKTVDTRPNNEEDLNENS